MLGSMLDPDQAVRPTSKECFHLLQAAMKEGADLAPQVPTLGKNSRKMSALSRFSIEGLEQSAGESQKPRKPFLFESKPSSANVTPLSTGRKRLSRLTPIPVRECSKKIVEGGSALEHSEPHEVFRHVVEERNLDSVLKVTSPKVSRGEAREENKIEVPIPFESSDASKPKFCRTVPLGLCERSPGLLLTMLSKQARRDLAETPSRSKWATRSLEAPVLNSGRSQFHPNNKLKKVVIADPPPVTVSSATSQTQKRRPNLAILSNQSNRSEEKQANCLFIENNKLSRLSLQNTFKRAVLTRSLDNRIFALQANKRFG